MLSPLLQWHAFYGINVWALETTITLSYIFLQSTFFINSKAVKPCNDIPLKLNYKTTYTRTTLHKKKTAFITQFPIIISILYLWLYLRFNSNPVGFRVYLNPFVPTNDINKYVTVSSFWAKFTRKCNSYLTVLFECPLLT